MDHRYYLPVEGTFTFVEQAGRVIDARLACHSIGPFRGLLRTKTAWLRTVAVTIAQTTDLMTLFFGGKPEYSVGYGHTTRTPFVGVTWFRL
jgi:hypothetical protein